MSNDLFLIASRKKYRFPSKVGDLTIEQLWDLPLSSVKGPSLDNTARTISSELKSEEESFVGFNPNPNRGHLSNKLELVKLVIQTRQAEITAVIEQTAKTARRKQIEEALAASDAKELSSASKDDLLKMLRELSN